MTMNNSNIKVFTIGAYGLTESSFLSALKSHNIDTFCDIRLRRGMRGAKFSWANSARLQANLKECGINYIYLKSLAPTKEIREEQKAEDHRLSVTKRERTKLGKVFIDRYINICEASANDFFTNLPRNATNVVLFCVEKEPSACHRSILANYICSNFNIENGGDILGWKP